MVALVKGLIGEGYSVGILSNIPTTLAGQVRKKQPWLEDCAAVTFSCDIGVAKPHPEAYRVAVDALSAQPKDTHFLMTASTTWRALATAGSTPTSSAASTRCARC